MTMVNKGKTSTFRSFVFRGFDYGTSQLLHTSEVRCMKKSGAVQTVRLEN